MTTKDSKSTRSRRGSERKTRRIWSSGSHWLLRDAKAKLSEVISRVHSEGPQRVTVRGEREVVIVTAEEFQRLKGEITGQVLIDALAVSPLRDLEFGSPSIKSPVRDVQL